MVNFTAAEVETLFTMMMHRAPRAGEIGMIHGQSRGVPEDVVCLIGRLPEFVRLHPSFIPKPLNEALAPMAVNGVTALVTQNDWVHATTRQSGEYEPWVAGVLHQILKPGSVFVDVGANIGLHSVLASHLVGPEGRVYSIEASLEVAAVTLANARNTGLGNMVVVNTPVTDKKNVEFILMGHGTTNRVVRTTRIDQAQFEFDLGLTDTLDSLLRHLDRLDLIKIDIEGREGSAFRGAEKLLERFRPKIVGEHHFKSPENWYVQEMIDRGYEMTVLSPGAPVPVGTDIDALQRYSPNKHYVDIFFTPKEESYRLADSRPRRHVIPGDSQRLGTAIGVRQGGGLRIEASVPAFAIYGPYVSLAPGRYRAAFDFESNSGGADMDVCHKGGTVVLARGPSGSLDFDAPEGASDLEVRLIVPTGFAGTVRQVSVSPRD